MRIFGNWLRLKRGQNTQSRLANAAKKWLEDSGRAVRGATKGNFNHYENGQNLPSLDVAEAISELLGTPYEETLSFLIQDKITEHICSTRSLRKDEQFTVSISRNHYWASKVFNGKAGVFFNIHSELPSFKSNTQKGVEAFIGRSAFLELIWIDIPKVSGKIMPMFESHLAINSKVKSFDADTAEIITLNNRVNYFRKLSQVKVYHKKDGESGTVRRNCIFNSQKQLVFVELRKNEELLLSKNETQKAPLEMFAFDKILNTELVGILEELRTQQPSIKLEDVFDSIFYKHAYEKHPILRSLSSEQKKLGKIFSTNKAKDQVIEIREKGEQEIQPPSAEELEENEYENISDSLAQNFHQKYKSFHQSIPIDSAYFKTTIRKLLEIDFATPQSNAQLLRLLVSNKIIFPFVDKQLYETFNSNTYSKIKDLEVSLDFKTIQMISRIFLCHIDSL